MADALAYQQDFDLDAREDGKSNSISFVDPFTDLWNRHAFEFRLSEELFRMRHHTGRPLSVLTVLVVGLDVIDRVYGRCAGDGRRRDVARLLAASVAQADMVARLTGDEFGVLLTRTGTQKAIRMAKHIHRQADAVARPCGQLPVALRVGTATTVDGNTTSRSLLICAQIAQQYDNPVFEP
jgi:diguanylate cyclase (GGDEF)-like protein